MKHQDKRKMAKKMQTRDERNTKGSGPFDSKAWRQRADKRRRKELERGE